MSYRETEHLPALIANERRDRPALVAPIVGALGHDVIAREIEVADVAAVTARERPDVALVGLGDSHQHALQLIEQIVQEAACPVIVLIHAPDPDFIKEARQRRAAPRRGPTACSAGTTAVRRGVSTRGRETCTPRTDRSGPTSRGSSGTYCRRRQAH
jgi:hypothetical protein